MASSTAVTMVNLGQPTPQVQEIPQNLPQFGGEIVTSINSSFWALWEKPILMVGLPNSAGTNNSENHVNNDYSNLKIPPEFAINLTIPLFFAPCTITHNEEFFTIPSTEDIEMGSSSIASMKIGNQENQNEQATTLSGEQHKVHWREVQETFGGASNPEPVKFDSFVYPMEKKFQIRENWATTMSEMNIRDSKGKLAFRVKNFFNTYYTMEDKLLIYDDCDRPVAKITSNFTIRAMYDVFSNGMKVATLKTNEDGSFAFDICETPGVRFEAKGTVDKHDFILKRGKLKVASIRNKKGNKKGMYSIKVTPCENSLLMVCCSLCLDKVLCSQEKLTN